MYICKTFDFGIFLLSSRKKQPLPFREFLARFLFLSRYLMSIWVIPLLIYFVGLSNLLL